MHATDGHPVAGRLAPHVGTGLGQHELRRYSRQIRMPQHGLAGQRLLKRSRVLVLGAGGLGSPALSYLAGAGVGVLGIVDDDTIEESNLQRQPLHAGSRIGSPKVDSAAAALAALNPHVAVRTHRVRLDAINAVAIFRDYDIVVDGTDNFETRYLTSDTAARLGMPHVWGSVLQYDGQYSTFWSRRPEGSLTLRDLYPQWPADGASCATAGVRGPLCGVIGSAMAVEAVKLITGVGEPAFGRLMVFDALEGSWTEVPFGPAHGSFADADGSFADAGVDAGARVDAVPVGDAGPGADAVPACGAGHTIGAPSEAAPATAAAPDAGTITAADAVRLLAADDVVLLDVREPWERAIVHVEGSHDVPLGDLAEDVARDFAGRQVLVLCHHGGRAARARDLLRGWGHPRARVVTGGIDAWSREVDDRLARY